MILFLCRLAFNVSFFDWADKTKNYQDSPGSFFFVLKKIGGHQSFLWGPVIPILDFW